MRQKRISIKTVALIDVGEGLQINLNTLEKKLNSIQRTFEFRSMGTITGEVIGNPNVSDQWYTSDTLFKALDQHYALPEFDFIVGVTAFKLTHIEAPDKEVEGEKDYFSISDCKRFSLISINTKVYQFNPKLKNIYQYTSYQIIAELLINMTHYNLMHTRPDACLFDDCEDRVRFADCINKSHICASCMNDLKNKNVSDQTLSDVLKVLSYCRQNDVKASLVYSIMHPLTTFVGGIGLGWLISIFIQQPYYLYIIIAILIIPFIIFARTQYSNR